MSTQPKLKFNCNVHPEMNSIAAPHVDRSKPKLNQHIFS